MHIGALGFVYRNTKEPITEIKAVVKENHNNSLSSHFFSAGTFWQLAPACSFRRKRSWIICCWLVWCERNIMFQLIIRDRIRASEQIFFDL